MNIFLSVVIHLALLLVEFVFGNPYSVSSEGTSSKLVDARSSSPEKYVSELYFEKHDRLVDDSFKGYIENELPIGLCETTLDNVNSKLSIHKRLLIGEGSHRQLLSTIKLDIQPDSITEKLSHLWKLVVVERLPSGVFADPFELQHLLDRGVFTDAVVLGDTNLELPSIASNRSLVEVHVNLHNGILLENNNAQIQIELPLHVRYPPLGESGLSRVEFGRPDLFIILNTEVKSLNHSCLLAKTSDFGSQRVVWEVPCGIKEHSRLVSVVTFVSAAVSALFIVLTTLSYPRIDRR